MLILLIESPLSRATLTNTTLPVALDMFSLPSVIVYVLLILVLNGTTSAPVLAHPSLPLPPPPVLLPGTPAPAYCERVSNQPFRPLALSIPVPGDAIHNPAIPVDELIAMSKFATTCLRNAKVKYCLPVSPDLSGPAGKKPLDRFVVKCCKRPHLIVASLVPPTETAPVNVLLV